MYDKRNYIAWVGISNLSILMFQELLFFKQMRLFQLSDVSLYSENPALYSMQRKTVQFNTWAGRYSLGTHLVGYSLGTPLQELGFESLLVPDTTCKLPRNQNRFPGGCSSELNTTETETEKQSRLNFVCFVNHKAKCSLHSQGARCSGLQSRQALFDPWKETGKLFCSKPSSVWGEITFSQQLFSFYHCSHLQLSRGCDAS